VPKQICQRDESGFIFANKITRWSIAAAKTVGGMASPTGF